jgi:hypothetical protein
VSHIRDLIEQGYFTEGASHAPGEENVPEPENADVIVFEEFFTSGLRLPPHPVLVDILLKFHV